MNYMQVPPPPAKLVIIERFTIVSFEIHYCKFRAVRGVCADLAAGRERHRAADETSTRSTAELSYQFYSFCWRLFVRILVANMMNAVYSLYNHYQLLLPV